MLPRLSGRLHRGGRLLTLALARPLLGPPGRFYRGRRGAIRGHAPGVRGLGLRLLRFELRGVKVLRDGSLLLMLAGFFPVSAEKPEANERHDEEAEDGHADNDHLPVHLLRGGKLFAQIKALLAVSVALLLVSHCV